MASRNPVLHLYNLCTQIADSEEEVASLGFELEGKAPHRLVNQIKAAVSALSLADLGVDPEHSSRYFPPSAITQVKVFSSDQLWIGLFCMGPGLGFPLHDHPSMTAFTYLLHGSIQVVSFDKLENSGPGLLKAKLAQNETVVAPAMLSLSHGKGNLHEILAIEPTIFLDIFMPFYSRERPCSYYQLVGQLQEDFFLMQCPVPNLPNSSLAYAGLPIE